MKIIRVVAGVLIEDGRVLAARRGPGRSQAGLWEFPGGKVEPRESDTDALIRELREELGVIVAVEELLGSSLHRYPTQQILLVALRCRLCSGVPQPTEHTALRWLSAEELHEVIWAPADVPLLASVQSRLTTSG